MQCGFGRSKGNNHGFSMEVNPKAGPKFTYLFAPFGIFHLVGFSLDGIGLIFVALDIQTFAHKTSFH